MCVFLFLSFMFWPFFPRHVCAKFKQIELSRDIKTLRDDSVSVFNAFTKEKSQQSLPGIHTKNVRCRECGENNVYYVQLQTRSMDEGATTFYTCAECGKCWVSFRVLASFYAHSTRRNAHENGNRKRVHTLDAKTNTHIKKERATQFTVCFIIFMTARPE